MWLFFCYTIQLITIKLCIKFQDPNSSSCCEIFDRKNIYMYYIRVKEGKSEKLNKEGKMRISILISIYTVHFAFLKVYKKFENTGSNSLSRFVPNFRILTQVVAQKSLTEKNVHLYYIREKEGKNENLKKEGKMRISILISVYTVHFAYLKVYTKFENTGSNRS